MNKPRLEAFTDAVVAIAATIMVLELHPPEEISVSALLELWPPFFAYIVSFFLIYFVWYSHHNLFLKAKVVSVATFIYNGIWLFLLTLIPFTTSWVGEEPNETLPELLYLIVIVLWTVLYELMDVQVMRDNPGVKVERLSTFWYRSAMYIVFLIAGVLSFIAPIWSLVIVGLVSIGFCAVLIKYPSGK